MIPKRRILLLLVFSLFCTTMTYIYLQLSGSVRHHTPSHDLRRF